MEWIYLSPHLDDAVLSCGGLIHQQVCQGDRVSIWTICAGDPPPVPLSQFALGQHAMWKLGSEATSIRRVEDGRACRRLGAAWRHLSVPDCIYRQAPEGGRPLYDSEEALFGPLDPVEKPLIAALAAEISRALPAGAGVVSPLGVGGHVDHRLTAKVADRLEWPIWYYAELPYVERVREWAGGNAPLREDPGWEEAIFPLEPEDLTAWQEAVEEYISQLPVLWPSGTAMRSGLAAYLDRVGGGRLWRRYPPEGSP